MSSDTTPQHDQDLQAQDQVDAAGNAAAGQTGETPAPTLEQQLAEASDRNLRLVAEMRNVQQRAQRERSEALRYAQADFARELLPAIDDLERALEALAKADGAATLTEGVRIARDHFLKILQAHGVQRIEAVGQPFDPDAHEAMLQQPSDEHAAGIVAQELAVGYRMHDRVLRTAKVIVSSGAK